MSFPLTKHSSQWENDNLVNDCNICKRKIVGKYFKTGKHHCRKCGKIICANCSKYKYNNHRICYDCNLILNNTVSNPYIDQTIIAAQNREFSPEKNKQFEYRHMPKIILRNNSESHSKSLKPYKSYKHNRNNSRNRLSDRDIPPPPPLPPPPPPPLITHTSHTKLKMDIIKDNQIKNQLSFENKQNKNGNHKISIDNNHQKSVEINKENDTNIVSETADNEQYITESKDEFVPEREGRERKKRDKTDKKRKKRKKHRKKHSKHHRNDAVTEMDDITTEIFLKLLLSFEKLEKNEEQKRKKRRKRRKKRREEKLRKAASNNTEIKSTETVDTIANSHKPIIKNGNGTHHKPMIIKNGIKKHRNHKQMIAKESVVIRDRNKENIVPNNRDSEEIKEFEKKECKPKILCGQSLRELGEKWLKLSANTFKVRPKNYYSNKKKKGKKMGSKPGMYNVFAVDAYQIGQKLKFAQFIQKHNIDIHRHCDNRKMSVTLPYLVVINVRLPLKKSSDKGLQLTFYSKLSPESMQILNTNRVSESMELFGKFIAFYCGNNESEVSEEMELELEESFKMTVKINNLKETKLPFLMKKLISRANGQSIAINENASFSYLDQRKQIFVIDIDGCNLSKSSLTMWNKVNLLLDSIQYDIGWHIGAHNVNYLPEQILLCAQIDKLSINEFTPINQITA